MTLNPQVMISETEAKLVIKQSLNDIFCGFVIGNVVRRNRCLIFIPRLFGVVLVEGYHYFQNYKDDSVYQKSFVSPIHISLIEVDANNALDALSFAFSIHMTHDYLVESFGGSESVVKIVWSDKALGMTQVLLIWLVQCVKGITSASKATLIFSTMHRYRCWFSGFWCNARRFGPHLSCFIDQAVIIEMSHIGPFIQDHDVSDSKVQVGVIHSGFLQWVVDLGFIVSGAMDITITAIMVFLLRSNATGIKKYYLQIDTIYSEHWTVDEEAVKPQAIFYLGIFNSQSKHLINLCMLRERESACVNTFNSAVYTISLLSLLNVRGKLRDDLDATVPLEIHFASVPRTATSPASPALSSTTSNIHIHNSSRVSRDLHLGRE
ncbi:hypothetical protein GYMLUDRAFT_1025924 [Collybiopsis luxurians FD-317 M1]|nr:hypothetical protein GYMLUDRAFT_1025924 [Collybiopsis luxurians FD-317 M1]